MTSFTNAKVEQAFSHMNRIKIDWQNRLGQKRIDNLMIISEEGPSAEDFNPDHANNAWYGKKKCNRLEVRDHINIQQRRQEQSIWQELLYLIKKTTQTVIITRLQFPIFCSYFL